METIVVEDFEVNNQMYERYKYDTEIPKWVYLQLRNKPLIKKAARFKLVSESSSEEHSFIDGEISAHSADNPRLIKVNLTIYIREKQIPIDASKTFIMVGSDQMHDESKENWEDLLNAIYTELLRK